MPLISGKGVKTIHVDTERCHPNEKCEILKDAKKRKLKRCHKGERCNYVAEMKNGNK